MKIGILLQSEKCPKWQREIINAIQEHKKLTLSVLIYNGEPRNTVEKKVSRSPKLLRVANSILNPFGHGLIHLYSLWDNKKHAEEDGLWELELVAVDKSVQQLTVEPLRKGHCHYFKDEDVAVIKHADLDVLIRFGFSIVGGDVLTSARYGMWSFHHGDNRFYRGGPPGVWELIKGKSEISVTLQLLNDVLDCGQTIARSSHRYKPFSVYQNKCTIYKACGDLLLKKLEQVEQQGFEFIKTSELFNEPIAKTKILKTPRNFEFFPAFVQCAKQYIAPRLVRNKKIQWFLAIKKWDGLIGDFSNAHVIDTPKDRFYADPILVSEANRQYVFLEEFVYKKGYAHISVGEIENNKLRNIEIIIDESNHLSHPFIVKDGDDYFLIPESRSFKSIRLYKCIQFPYQWRLEKEMFVGEEMLDPTIWKQGGTYYLFANKYTPERKTSNEELHIFYSDSLLGGWKSHPLNPVAVDICNSRPAGNLFLHDGKLIMVNQNCSLRYGHSMTFNEITLSKTFFDRKVVKMTNPNWLKGNLGTHTWNREGEVVIFDGHRYIEQ